MGKGVNKSATYRVKLQPFNIKYITLYNFTYSLRHCDLVQLQGLRGRDGGDDSGEVLKQQQQQQHVYNY